MKLGLQIPDLTWPNDAFRSTDGANRAGTRCASRPVRGARLPDYFQEAQIALLDPRRERMFQAKGPAYLIAKHNVSYLRRLTFRDDPIQVDTVVSSRLRDRRIPREVVSLS